MNNPENLKPWKKGESGNPAGRPPGSRNRSTVIREWLDCEATDGHGGTKTDQIVRAQILKAEAGDSTAFRTLMDSAYGKLPDIHQIDGVYWQPNQSLEGEIDIEKIKAELAAVGLPTEIFQK